MTEIQEPGRRERKKAATRRAIADAALEMFLERGYEGVTIKQIADRADVSLATVYAHFPQKEALVFDEDDARRESLLAAVRRRDDGVRVIEALHGWLRSMVEEGRQYADQQAVFEAMIQSAPALVAYERAMWLRHEGALAAAIADELGADPRDPRIHLFSHFVLESWCVVDVSDDPLVVLDAMFDLLEPGWLAVEPKSAG
jgi:AcrR family transcriptional regulator